MQKTPMKSCTWTSCSWGSRACKYKYVLFINDNLNSYTWLLSCADPDVENDVHCLSQWIAEFESMVRLFSDCGSHLMSQVAKGLTEQAHIHCHLVTAYFPWANGTKERLQREVLQASRELRSEWKLKHSQWPSIIDWVQFIINQSPHERLERGEEGAPATWLSPAEMFTEIELSAFFVDQCLYNCFRILGPSRSGGLEQSWSSCHFRWH